MTLGQRFKYITLANLCALLLYLVSGLLANTVLSAVSPTKTVTWTVLSLLTMTLFTVLLIRFSHLKGGKGERQYIQSLRETGRAESGISVSEDCKLLFREEAGMILTCFAVNLLCWGLECIDVLLFSKQTVTMVLLLFAPMHMLVSVLPDWGYGIIGFLVSTVIDVLLYLLILLYDRKKWRAQVTGG
ncbi:MAG: hypothetical protein J1E00_06575 [Oscillospiraceae bacterium]|nr:hypothetical protein [Oscillospiraceae bacterium]